LAADRGIKTKAGRVCPRAVLFDFGRVISAQKPAWLFGEYERILGLPAGSFQNLFDNSPEWRDALLGRMTLDGFWEAVGPKLGLRTSEGISRFRHRFEADEAPNRAVVGLILRLRGRCRLAVLSNSPPGLSRWLEKWGILDCFDVVFCSGEEGVAKPNPRAYLETLERLGVEPSEAVFVDDEAVNVDAARRLGLRTVLFTDYDSLFEELENLFQDRLAP